MARYSTQGSCASPCKVGLDFDIDYCPNSGEELLNLTRSIGCYLKNRVVQFNDLALVHHPMALVQLIDWLLEFR